MIVLAYDFFELLHKAGIDSHRIYTEVYGNGLFQRAVIKKTDSD